MPVTPFHPPTDTDAQDRAWLRAVALRDRSAFEALYRHHHGRLARFLIRFTSRRDVIDEVINDSFWIVWRKAADFRGDSKVSTWIIGIAYRSLLKALRQTAPAQEVSESTLDDFSLDAIHGSPVDDQARELRDWLARGLDTLPEDQRATLVLAYFMGESCEDIAAIMGCAVGTVKARMFHARMRLRNCLPALGGDAPRTQGEKR